MTRIGLSSPLQQVQVLDAHQCATVRDDVHALRELWIRRSTLGPFFTLGAASYLDASLKGSAAYYARAAQYNPILRGHFGWLYRRIGEVVAELLDAPASYPDALALPGFHVYLAAKLFELPVSSVHRDLQYLHIRQETPNTASRSHPRRVGSRARSGSARHISFTLAIALPERGAGLNVWEVPTEELEEKPWKEIEASLATHPCRFYPYSLGEMTLHSGEVVHQAALMADVQPSDERITLQGHGLFRGDTWELYW